VADDDRLAVEPADDRLLVVGDLADALAGEDLRLLLSLRDRLRLVRPARRQRDESMAAGALIETSN
jgi:hypothetical protein